MRKKIILSFFILTSLAAIAQDENDSVKVKVLDEVVISANKFSEKRKKYRTED
jgi:hypothetical protein